MKFSDFRKYFSSSRTLRYLDAVSQNRAKAVKLYKANLKVAQTFHPIIGVCEVVLRNRMNDMLHAHFGDPDWIINQKNGFMSDPSLRYTHKRTGRVKTNDWLKGQVTNAENGLRKSGNAVTSGRVLAEQSFGFWTDLFEVHHFKILKGRPIQIFHGLPAGIGRKEVCDELTKIRRFRNRINHNEPICFNHNTIDFTIALDVHSSIMKLLGWIDPQLTGWMAELDKVSKEILRAEKLKA